MLHCALFVFVFLATSQSVFFLALARSHLGRYLHAQADGSWKGEAEAPNADCVWGIEPRPNGTWALKSKYGYYANVKGDTLSAYVKEIPADMSGEWVVHLAMHPQ